MKSEASNAEKNLIETIMAELTRPNVIINKKTCHRLDFFCKSSTTKQSIGFTIIKTSPCKTNSISNDKLTIQKQLSQSLSQSFSEISGNLPNINTPIVETLSENQRGINVSQARKN